MADLLQSGMGWLADQLKASASQEVRYTRESQSVYLQATFGRTLLRLSDPVAGSRVEWTDKTITVLAADLVLGGGTATRPVRGDEVRYTDAAGTTHLYEVLAPGNEPVWTWADGQGTRLSIHLKYLGEE